MEILEQIPQEMKDCPQWVLWNPKDQRRRANGDAADGNKIPLNPETLGRASSTDPTTWGTWAQVEARAAEGYGVGFVLTENDPYLCIDLDHAVNEGEVSPQALEIIDAMDSYTETSPSGEGVHIFVRAVKPGKRSRGGGVEMYTDGRYIRMTGRVIGGRDAVRNAQEAVRGVYTKYLEPDKGNALKTPQTPPQRPEYTPDAQEVVDRATRSKNGSLFESLMRGDTSAYDGDASRADLALCSILAFYAQGDEQTIDAIFRQSGLMRPKWDEMHGGTTYGQMTIEAALRQPEYYTGKNPNDGARASAMASAGIDLTQPWESSSEAAYTAYMGQLHAVDPLRTIDEIKTLSGFRDPVPTGIKVLDDVLGGGLQQGLCILGAISSLGKTTLTVQIADNVAASGRPVLFVTIEQRAVELVSKSLSRIIKQQTGTALTTRTIMNKVERDGWGEDSDRSKALDAAIEAYTATVAPNMRILEPLGKVGVSDVVKAARAMAWRYGTAPVVFIDYLQLLAPQSEYDSDKKAVDNNITALRQMAGELKTTVFAISSLNRNSYSGVISLESFKESGGIEYGADVLLGLQPYDLAGLLEGVPEKDRKAKAAKEVKRLKASSERHTEIVVLKQRNGITPEDGLHVVFTPACCLFEEPQRQSTWSASSAKKSSRVTYPQ